MPGPDVLGGSKFKHCFFLWVSLKPMKGCAIAWRIPQSGYVKTRCGLFRNFSSGRGIEKKMADLQGGARGAAALGNGPDNTAFDLYEGGLKSAPSSRFAAHVGHRSDAGEGLTPKPMV